MASNAQPKRPFRIISRIERNDACAGGDFLEAYIRGRAELGNGEAVEVTVNAASHDSYQPWLYLHCEPSLGTGDDCVAVSAEQLEAFGQLLLAVAKRMRARLPQMVAEMRQWEGNAHGSDFPVYDPLTRGGISPV